jgi:integrase
VNCRTQISPIVLSKALGQRLDVRDGKMRGLILRVSDKGTKTWSVLYRRKSDGRRRRCTCGTYPQISLSEARTNALDILARVARGEDPARDRKRVPADRLQTFGDLAERYLKHAEASKRSGFQDRRILDKDVLPGLGREPLEAIRRADVGEIIQRIAARGSPIQANRTFEIIRGMYNWALGAGLVETTPCLGLKAPSSKRSRERTLTSEEVRRFWRALPSARMAWPTAQILRLCLVTAQRVGEVAGARKSEVNISDREWRLPGHRVKNGSAHSVPLSSLAAELFQEAIAETGDDDLIFPGRILKRSVAGHSVGTAMRFSLDILGLENATPHDLRRTAATGMARLGVTRLVIDKVLNHVSADRSTIAGVYDRHAYEEEKREALESWSKMLSTIVGAAS